jgi:hypothetical protein
MLEYGAFRFAFNFNTTNIDNITLQISTFKLVSHKYICILVYVE